MSTLEDVHSHAHHDACGCHGERSAGKLPALVEVFVLLVLAAFLGYAALSGRVAMFVAKVYTWLPPAAAVLLALMGVARLCSVLRGRPGCDDDCHARPGPARWLLCAGLVAPVVAALAVDPQQFSTEGVRKRQMPLASRDPRLESAMAWVLGRAAPGSAGPAAAAALSAEPTVLQLTQSSENGQAGDWAGRFVHVIGQCDVTPDPAPQRFGLYRFVVTCCVADAQAVALDVITPMAVPAESRDWVRVGGILRVENPDSGGRITIHAATISKIPPPATPFL